jgi:hypothetical protein
MNSQRHIGSCVILLLSGACASAEGTKPHDMSTAQHEAAASREEAQAQQHSGQYAPDASEKVQHCARAGGARGSGGCWTSTVNPTEQHKTDATEHKQVAEQHRGAAQALRDVENTSCSGLDEEDRATSPFYHREDISQVGKADVSVSEGYGAHEAFAGGRAVFRAVPGMTAEWLQRLVNCHLARAAAVGFAMPEMSYCPLMLKGVTATTSSVGDGFAITVTSTDPATATEIWRRIQALKSSAS